ncbi:hypothetical protein EV426DRAFT_721066 [Tirmania nivea]|nr:hypothetical protein EV426DRAFT_721066 [Tirmania nivea]
MTTAFPDQTPQQYERYRYSQQPALPTHSFSQHFVNRTDFYPGPPTNQVVHPWPTAIDALVPPSAGTVLAHETIPDPLLFKLLIQHGLVSRSMAEDHQGLHNMPYAGHYLHSSEILQGCSRPPLSKNSFDSTYQLERYAVDVDEEDCLQIANRDVIPPRMFAHAPLSSPTGIISIRSEVPMDELGNANNVQRTAVPSPRLQAGCAYAGRSRPTYGEKHSPPFPGPAGPIKNVQAPPNAALEKGCDLYEEEFHNTILAWMEEAAQPIRVNLSVGNTKSMAPIDACQGANSNSPVSNTGQVGWGGGGGEGKGRCTRSTVYSGEWKHDGKGVSERVQYTEEEDEQNEGVGKQGNEENDGPDAEGFYHTIHVRAFVGRASGS